MATRTHSTAVATAVDPDKLEELWDTLGVVARVTSRVAAQNARGNWDDFAKLLVHQYGCSHADAEAFLDILNGRRP